MRSAITRLVSGGQTGVDRAALDIAVELGIPYEGWCPAGGWAEDLTEPPGLLARYPGLRATPSADPRQRTMWNVRDSDLTLLVRPPGTTSTGTDLTESSAQELGRPVVHSTGDIETTLDTLVDAAADLGSPFVLDVAGPRASEWEKGYEVTRRLLTGFAEAGVLSRPGRWRRRG